MQELQIFKNKELGEIRTILIDNQPYFVGKDVAETLGYTNTNKAIKDHVDEEDKLTERIVMSGQNREVILINESGLYSLILTSKLPSANKFKRWVTNEVLPSIRETGAYNTNQSKQLTALEQLDLQRQAILEVNDKVEALEKDMPLFKAECDELQDLVHKVGVRCLGGKNKKAYNDASLRGRVYADIQHQLKREFGVNKYAWIKHSQFNKAKEIISNYTLPIVLEDEIILANNQLEMEDM